MTISKCFHKRCYARESGEGGGLWFLVEKFLSDGRNSTLSKRGVSTFRGSLSGANFRCWKQNPNILIKSPSIKSRGNPCGAKGIGAGAIRRRFITAPGSDRQRGARRVRASAALRHRSEEDTVGQRWRRRARFRRHGRGHPLPPPPNTDDDRPTMTTPRND